MKRCPFCAEEIQDAAILCKHCHSDLVAGVPASRAALEGKNGRKAWALWSLWALAGVLALGGIAAAIGGGEDQPQQPRTIRSMMEELPEDKRAELLGKTIAGAGARCTEVNRTFHQGSSRDTGADVWNATCAGGRSYSVRIAEDEQGTTKVLDCLELKALGQGECFKPF